MNTSVKSLEQDIESEIAALEKELAELAPFPAIAPAPVYTVGEKNVISVDFNRGAGGEALDAYRRDLPRRQGLERRIAYYKRCLHALQVQSAYAAEFIRAA